MSAMLRLTVGVLAGLLVSALLLGPATAATVGTGDLEIDVTPSGAPQPYSGTVVFDDRIFDLFGTAVNLGQDAPIVDVTGGVVLQGFGGTFTAEAESANPGVLSGSAAGDFICPESAVCLSGPVSFVATFSSVGGTLPPSWPGGTTYTFDGTVTYTAGTAYHYTGRLAVNAFQPVATAASAAGCSGSACEVTVDPAPTTIVNSGNGADVVVEAHIVFPRVTTAGDTTVTAVSNVAGQVQANFAFNDDATFVDISTTAVFDTAEDLIRICLDYGIAGTVGDPLALRLMHLEDGVWIDVTSSLDPATQTICGRVASLSPFGVALQTGCAVDGDCDDSNPCSSDTCNVGTCVHAAANAGTVCRPAANGCDPEEACDGSSTTCPPDVSNGCGTTTTTSTEPPSSTSTTSTSSTSTTTDTTTSSTATSPPSSSTSSTEPPSSTTTTSTSTTSTTTTTLLALDVASATLHAASNAAGTNGSIRVTGDFAVSPSEPFSATAGVAVRVQDGAGHDQTHQFAAADCTTRPSSGRIQCRSADRSAKAKFAPSRKAAGRFTFSIQLKRLALDPPFEGPVQLTMTSDNGLDRTGSIASCTGVGPGLKCKTP